MKMFPIMDGHIHGRAKDTLPLIESVPWAFVEPVRERCLRVHEQTLERLAERGGLSIGEFWCHVHAPEPFSLTWWFRTAPPPPDEVREWIRGLYLS